MFIISRLTQINAYLFTGLALFQKSGVKRARQKLGHVKLLALTVQVCEDDRGAARKLPDDLTTRTARRRQCFGVRDHGELRKLSFTFRQRLPDRDAFRANCQTITRTLDVTARVNLAAGGLHRSADLEIRKRRD